MRSNLEENLMASDSIDMAQDAAQRAGAFGSELVDSALNTADDIKQRARSTMNDLAGTAADVADRVSTRASDALERGLRYTSAHPLQALGVVLIAGFLVGRLSRR